MNQRGKVAKLWERARIAYLAAHPPNHQGYYICYLCGRWIPANEITLDHIIARSRRPDLRFVQSNLAVCCSSCNEAKGSRAVKKQEPIPRKADEIDDVWGAY